MSRWQFLDFQIVVCTDDIHKPEGESIAEAIEMASDVLCLRLYDIEEAGEPIPSPSDISNLSNTNGTFVSMVACDTLDYRKFYDKKSVKKTLTIPNWLNLYVQLQDTLQHVMRHRAVRQRDSIHDETCPEQDRVQGCSSRKS